MTNYQEGNDPRAVPEPQYPNQGQVPPDPYSQPTASYPSQPSYPNQPQPPGQPQWDRGPDRYGEPMRRDQHRQHVQIRSTFLTTEFWALLVISAGILIASAVTDEGADGQGFGAHDAWILITLLAIGYMISRGLTKLGGNRRDGGDRGSRL